VATVGVDDPASVEVDKSVATVGVDDQSAGRLPVLWLRLWPWPNGWP
jgi:hypothetical protein